MCLSSAPQGIPLAAKSFVDPKPQGQHPHPKLATTMRWAYLVRLFEAPSMSKNSPSSFIVQAIKPSSLLLRTSSSMSSTFSLLWSPSASTSRTTMTNLLLQHGLRVVPTQMRVSIKSGRERNHSGPSWPRALYRSTTLCIG